MFILKVSLKKFLKKIGSFTDFCSYLIPFISARRVDSPATRSALSTVHAASLSATVITPTTTVSTVTGHGCCRKGRVY